MKRKRKVGEGAETAERHLTPQQRMQLAPRCKATSWATGLRCKQPAIRGGEVCIVHGGGSPAAKAKAAQRIATMVDPALEVMLNLLVSKKTTDSVRFNVAKDILDRAGHKPVEKSENVNWNGDLSAMTDEQLEAMTQYFERIGYSSDRAKLEADKRRALVEAGTVIDVQPVEDKGGDW